MPPSNLPPAFAPRHSSSEAQLNNDDGGELEAFHELRVRIPTDVHRQLLALKILRGATLAQTVSTALDRYFAGRADGEPSPKTP